MEGPPTRRSIWSFEIKQGAIITPPAGAKILSVAWWKGAPMIWTLADPEVPKVRRRVEMLSTGLEIYGENWEYAGMITSPEGKLWHVFVEIV